jgi:hypothetical protein
VNLLGGGAFGPRQVVAQAQFLVLFVDQAIGAALAGAQGGSVSLGQTQVQAWQTLLRFARDSLNQLPVPAIFPPPRWAQLVGQAVTQIDQALALLESIKFVTTLIFPPQPGQASVPVTLLQQVQARLRAASQALSAAQTELG